MTLGFRCECDIRLFQFRIDRMIRPRPQLRGETAGRSSHQEAPSPVYDPKPDDLLRKLSPASLQRMCDDRLECDDATQIHRDGRHWEGCCHRF